MMVFTPQSPSAQPTQGSPVPWNAMEKKRAVSTIPANSDESSGTSHQEALCDKRREVGSLDLLCDQSSDVHRHGGAWNAETPTAFVRNCILCGSGTTQQRPKGNQRDQHDDGLHFLVF